MARRRWHLSRWTLLLAFVVVPLVEIYVIIQIGQVIGAWWTILLLIADSVFGSWLVAREGRRAWAALTGALGSGRMPSRELADGALLLIGGTLMLSPGFVTDAIGVLLILPFTRPLARGVLTRVITRRLLVTTTSPNSGSPKPGPPKPGSPEPGSPGPIVRGEVVDDDETTG